MLVLDFVFGGLAAVGASVFTNPLEVIKIRMQLQGELARAGTYKKKYSNVFTSMITIIKNEGLSGIQKGFVPASGYQFIMNSIRLGTYETAVRENLMLNEKGEISTIKSFFWGSAGCVVGSVTANPFYLIKIQMQAQAAKNIAVGYQHKHTGMLNAMQNITSKHGLRSLWRNCQATAFLSGLGSGVQLATYSLAKEFITINNLVTDRASIALLSSFIGGTTKTVLILPIDIITVRVFNQPVDKNGKGIMYRGLIDCIGKIFRTEGITGFYKAFWPSFFRVVPHNTITLSIYDYLLFLRSKYVK